MTLPDAPALTAQQAERWTALTPSVWWKRSVALLWVVAVVVAFVTDTRPCTPQDPTVCGPDPTFAWWIVVCLSTPVLLLAAPRLGCAAGIAFALADLRYDPSAAARTAFAVHGGTCLLLVLLLRHLAGRQRGVLGQHAELLVVPDGAAATPSWRLRAAVALGLAVVGLAPWGWYQHQVARERSTWTARSSPTSP